jgi:hypothetical protein
MMLGPEVTSTTRGVLFVHSAPSALCPHIEWAVGGVFGVPVRVDWIAQPIERACYRTEYSWAGPCGTAARLASALKGWQRVRFEVTEEATSGTEGERYSYTPALGMFYAITGTVLALAIIGLIFTGITAFRILGGRSGELELASAHAMYWYFVAAAFSGVWFLVYVTK